MKQIGNTLLLALLLGLIVSCNNSKVSKIIIDAEKELANFHYNNAEYDKHDSICYFQIKLAKIRNEKDEVAYFLNCLGLSKYAQLDYEDANEYFKLALKYYYETENQVQIAKIYNNFGLVYQEEGLNSFALQNYFKAIQIRHENHISQLPLTLINIAFLYTQQNKLIEAENFLDTALKITKDPDDLIESKICKARIMYQSSLHFGTQQETINYLTSLDHDELCLINDNRKLYLFSLKIESYIQIGNYQLASNLIDDYENVVKNNYLNNDKSQIR